MTDWTQQWLAGADGLSRSDDGTSWTRLGSLEFNITGIVREPERIVAAAGFGSGLYEWQNGGTMWKQLHDETLTEILCLAPMSGDPGVVAGSPYGIATAVRDAVGAARWSHHSDDLRVNERYTNCILVDPYETDCWLVGTEGGVLIATDRGNTWERTTLNTAPVRSLFYALDTYWAGTDGNGIWRSSDGLRWDRAGTDMEDARIYDLTESDGRIIAGSGTGVLVGDGVGKWTRCGPSMLTASIAAHPKNEAQWLAGSAPGGLWNTDDAGSTWRQIEGFKGVLSILAPEGGQS